MKYCSNRDIDQVIRQLIRQGWSFRRGSKHGRLTPPDGQQTLTVAKSPSDYRSLLNFRRDLRKVASHSVVSPISVLDRNSSCQMQPLTRKPASLLDSRL